MMGLVCYDRAEWSEGGLLDRRMEFDVIDVCTNVRKSNHDPFVAPVSRE